MSVTPSPIGGFAAQFFDNNGVILSGGKIYTYAAGTTTPQAVYTSASGATPHANPIILDSAGRVPGGEIWLTDGLVYKFVIETATAILIGTYDNITGINSNFVNYTIQEEVQTATANQTVFNLSTINYTPGTNSLTVYIDGVNQYVGDSYLETDSDTVTFTSGVHVGGEVKFTTAIQTTTGSVDASIVTFTGFNGQTGVVQDLADNDGSDWIGFEQSGTGAVARSAQDKMRDFISVKDFGAVGDGAIDDTDAIQNAVDYAFTNDISAVYVPAGIYKTTKPIVLWGGFNYSGSASYLYGDGVNASIIKKTTNTTLADGSNWAAIDAVIILGRYSYPTADQTVYNVAISNLSLQGAATSSAVDFGIAATNACGQIRCEKLDIRGVDIGTQFQGNTFLSTFREIIWAGGTFPLSKGFSMTASGTSVLLEDTYVFASTVIAYELRSLYSTAINTAADACSGTIYDIRFSQWNMSGVGSESPLATTVVLVDNDSQVNMNAATLFVATSGNQFTILGNSNLSVVNSAIGYASGQSSTGYYYLLGSGCSITLDSILNYGTFATASTGVATSLARQSSGTFTSTASTASAVSGTWTAGTGKWTQVGNVVTMQIQFTGTNLGFSSTSGYYKWTGLPTTYVTITGGSGTWVSSNVSDAVAGVVQVNADGTFWIYAPNNTNLASSILVTATYFVS
jgi:hypothetical protein